MENVLGDATVHVFVLHDDFLAVLMVRNTERFDENGYLIKPEGWGGPCGRIEAKDLGANKNESLKNAGCRETKEETGFEIGFDVDDEPLIIERYADYSLYVLRGEIIGGKMRTVFKKNDEVNAVDWVAIDHLLVPAEIVRGKKIYKYKGTIIYNGHRKRTLKILAQLGRI